MQRNIKQTYEGLYRPNSSGRPIAPEYQKFAKAWGWYKLISDVANNNVLLFDKITKLPLTEVFTFVQFQKDKEIAEAAQRKLDRKLAKLKKNDDT